MKVSGTNQTSQVFQAKMLPQVLFGLKWFRANGGQKKGTKWCPYIFA